MSRYHWGLWSLVIILVGFAWGAVAQAQPPYYMGYHVQSRKTGQSIGPILSSSRVSPSHCGQNLSAAIYVASTVQDSSLTPHQIENAAELILKKLLQQQGVDRIERLPVPDRTPVDIYDEVRLFDGRQEAIQLILSLTGGEVTHLPGRGEISIPLEATVYLLKADGLLYVPSKLENAQETATTVAEAAQAYLQDKLPSVLNRIVVKACKSAPAERRLALVIGNSDYGSSEDNLINPVHDAEDIAATLEQVRFKVIRAYNVNKEQMEQRIKEFAQQLKSFDVGLFYFSGHGQQTGGQDYLIPTGAMQSIKQSTDLNKNAVWVQSVINVMKGAGNKLNIMILDACRNNTIPFTGGTKPEGLSQKIEPPDGWLIAYATEPGKMAKDGKGGNSPYVKYLKKELLKPQTTIEGVFKNVQSAIKKESTQQRPTYQSHLNRDFCFISCP